MKLSFTRTIGAEILMSHEAVRSYVARVAGLAALMLALSAVESAATPIVYLGTLTNGVPANESMQETFGPDSLNNADFWLFYAATADIVTVTVARQNPEYDPVFWLFSGDLSATTQEAQFGGNDGPTPLIDSGDPGFIAFANDELPPALPGPAGDPSWTSLIAASGYFTVIVTNGPNTVGLGEGNHFYGITVTGNSDPVVTPVPEVSSAATLLAGIAALGVAYRRRRRA
jgi:hypothetical protein